LQSSITLHVNCEASYVVIRACTTLTLELSLGISEINIRDQLFTTFHTYCVLAIIFFANVSYYIYYETDLKNFSLYYVEC
jgi:hypothetical protein